VSYYPPSARLGFHPYLPERLGFRRVLRRTNGELADLLDKTDAYTLVTARSRTTLYREARGVIDRKVPGDFIELGVHRGGSAAVLAHVLKDQPDRKLHLFDRWGDLPETTEEDGYRAEQYRRDNIPEKLAYLRDDPPLPAAKRVIEKIVGFPKDRLFYYPGWYNETLGEYKGGPIALASVDCDYYESVKPALAFIEQHMSPGGVIIIDDYGTWPGARRAVHEWLDAKPGRASLHVLKRMGNAVLRVAG
jgi:O-methyltransferase